jgi:hypothetical protein
MAAVPCCARLSANRTAASRRANADGERRHLARLLPPAQPPITDYLLSLIHDAKRNGLGPRLIQCVLSVIESLDAAPGKGTDLYRFAGLFFVLLKNVNRG